MLAHRLLGGCSSTLRISFLSLVSRLIATARAHLWRSFRQCSESPLLCTRKQWSLASQPGPDFSPDSFPASCGALAPFRLCSRRQPQFSPWGLTSEAKASAPSLHPPQRVSREASQVGECLLAPILCAGISLLCPLHPCCCALLCGSKSSPPHPPSLPVKGLPSVWKLFLLHSSYPEVQAHPYSFVSVFPFFFCPTQVCGEFLAFWEV